MTLTQDLRKYASNPGYSHNDYADTMRAAANEIERLSAAQSAETAAQSALAVARDALKFYADGDHFVRHDPGAWDTVSGEPPNFYEDENNTATVEDGSIAKQALESIAMAGRFIAEPPSRVAIENAALERAAQVCDLMHCRPEFEEEFHDKQLRIAATQIRALKQAEPQQSAEPASKPGIGHIEITGGVCTKFWYAGQLPDGIHSIAASRLDTSSKAEAGEEHFIGRVFVDQLTGTRSAVLNRAAAALPDMARIYAAPVPAQPAPPVDDQDVFNRVCEVLGEFRRQDDWLLAHGASLMSEDSHEIIHIDTVSRIIEAVRAYVREPAPSEAAQEQNRDWTEDAAHENGNYQCLCCECGSVFKGHKRRVICKACDAQPAPARDDVHAALKELVACKDLKDMIYQVTTTQRQAELHDEYERRKPAAWAAARAALQGQPAAVTDQAKDAAVRFAGMVLAAHRNDGYPSDVDGADLQDMALKCGLIEQRTVSEPCGETCSCAEVADFPAECFFNTDAGRAAIAASKEAS